MQILGEECPQLGLDGAKSVNVDMTDMAIEKLVKGAIMNPQVREEAWNTEVLLRYLLPEPGDPNHLVGCHRRGSRLVHLLRLLLLERHVATDRHSHLVQIRRRHRRTPVLQKALEGSYIHLSVQAHILHRPELLSALCEKIRFPHFMVTLRSWNHGPSLPEPTPGVGGMEKEKPGKLILTFLAFPRVFPGT